jgi:predicted TIM-barrel fold metal-dependent hydrolase
VIVDCHTHVWPDAIAAKALGPAVPHIERHGDGTERSLLATMAAAAVDRAICLGVADGPGRVDAVNRFAGSLKTPLIGFGSAHPSCSPDALVESLEANGVRGVKLHPVFQRYRLDDPGLREILDTLQARFVVIAHVGEVGDKHGLGLSTPAMVSQITRDFPRLDFIACHFGGYLALEEGEDLVAGLPVFVDTSWPPSLAGLDPGRIRRFIGKHGAERVVFGSDWPVANPASEIAAIEQLGLTTSETEAVLGGNLQRLLQLEV